MRVFVKVIGPNASLIAIRWLEGIPESPWKSQTKGQEDMGEVKQARGDRSICFEVAWSFWPSSWVLTLGLGDGARCAIAWAGFWGDGPPHSLSPKVGILRAQGQGPHRASMDS